MLLLEAVMSDARMWLLCTNWQVLESQMYTMHAPCPCIQDAAGCSCWYCKQIRRLEDVAALLRWRGSGMTETVHILCIYTYVYVFVYVYIYIYTKWYMVTCRFTYTPRPWSYFMCFLVPIGRSWSTKLSINLCIYIYLAVQICSCSYLN